jgi:hypothetical protein
MTDHIFGNENFFEYFAIVNEESVADKFRRNLAISGPGFDGFFFSGDLETLDLDDELLVYVWAFF